MLSKTELPTMNHRVCLWWDSSIQRGWDTVGMPNSQPWCYLWLWARCSDFPCLSFLICELELIIILLLL